MTSQVHLNKCIIMTKIILRHYTTVIFSARMLCRALHLQLQGHQSHKVQCQWHPQGCTTWQTWDETYLTKTLSYQGWVPCSLFQSFTHSALGLKSCSWMLIHWQKLSIGISDPLSNGASGHTSKLGALRGEGAKLCSIHIRKLLKACFMRVWIIN